MYTSNSLQEHEEKICTPEGTFRVSACQHPLVSHQPSALYQIAIWDGFEFLQSAAADQNQTTGQLRTSWSQIRMSKSPSKLSD